MKKIAIATYLISLHILCALLLIRTDFSTRVIRHLAEILKPSASRPLTREEDLHILASRALHSRMDPFVPRGATIFLGDSITMGLTTAAVAPYAVNFGIGWQRSDQLIASMDIYESINRAKQVVITIGTNDLLQGKSAGIEARYKTILSRIPPDVEIIMSSILPIGSSALSTGLRDAQRAKEADVLIVVEIAKHACEAVKRCRFVNAFQALSKDGVPLPGVLLEDDVHLSIKGYELWIKALR